MPARDRAAPASTREGRHGCSRVLRTETQPRCFRGHLRLPHQICAPAVHGPRSAHLARTRTLPAKGATSTARPARVVAIGSDVALSECARRKRRMSRRTHMWSLDSQRQTVRSDVELERQSLYPKTKRSIAVVGDRMPRSANSYSLPVSKTCARYDRHHSV